MTVSKILLIALAGIPLAMGSGTSAKTPHKTVHRPVSSNPATPATSVIAANAAATREPEPGSYLNAVQVYTFVDGSIYRLFTAPDKVSDIVLQPQEQLIAISAGDTARWVIGDTVSGTDAGRQVHILVKPFSAGLKTNLIVITNRRTYHLDLQSTTRTAMAAISWRYPQDDVLTKSVEAVKPDTTNIPSIAFRPESLQFNYTITGAKPSWRPVRAFDDGQKVYIEFPATISQGELPPLYLLGAGGKAELTNYRLSGRYYIVDQIFTSAELRLGAKHQAVVRITRAGVGHD